MRVCPCTSPTDLRCSAEVTCGIRARAAPQIHPRSHRCLRRSSRCCGDACCIPPRRRRLMHSRPLPRARGAAHGGRVVPRRHSHRRPQVRRCSPTAPETRRGSRQRRRRSSRSRTGMGMHPRLTRAVRKQQDHRCAPSACEGGRAGACSAAHAISDAVNAPGTGPICPCRRRGVAATCARCGGGGSGGRRRAPRPGGVQAAQAACRARGRTRTGVRSRHNGGAAAGGVADGNRSRRPAAI